MIRKLDESELAEALRDLPLWTYDENRKALYRKVQLADFSAAIGFMMRVALAAEKADHHPEWSNVYGRVEIWLTTHAASGVSRRDPALAAVIDGLI